MQDFLLEKVFNFFEFLNCLYKQKNALATFAEKPQNHSFLFRSVLYLNVVVEGHSHSFLFRSVPFLDVVVGGHSHSFLYSETEKKRNHSNFYLQEKFRHFYNPSLKKSLPTNIVITKKPRNRKTTLSQYLNVFDIVAKQMGFSLPFCHFVFYFT